MLVIGFSVSGPTSFTANLSVDPDEDSPQEIHDALSVEADGMQFNLIVVVNKDEVVAEYSSDDGDFTTDDLDDDEDDDFYDDDEDE